VSAPRRGSLGFRPRARARSIIARVRSWPEVTEGPKLLGFAGYKVGMTHVVMVEDWPGAPMYGRDVVKAATIIEVPPLYVGAVRAYSKSHYGLNVLSEAWAETVPKDLGRCFKVPEKFDFKSSIERIASNLSNVSELRLILCSQPRKAGIRKKKPEIFEVKVGGGSVEEAWDYSKSLVGSELNVGDVFKEGDYLDVISVSRGRGYQGVVKRHGIKIPPRWHKHRKGHRKIGSIGPAHPGVMRTIPRGGQLGFHQRTEYNKRILKIGENGDEINPKGGFKHYGIIRGPYIILEGSVPGTIKRFVKLRYTIRPSSNAPSSKPRLIYVHV